MNGLVRRMAAPLVAAGITAAAVGAVAWASIPDGSGAIHGCYKTTPPHTLVVIDSASQSCSAAQTSLNWSQTGPPGPPGNTGPAGPSASYVVKNGTAVPLSANTPATVAQMKLPKGAFVVFARAQVENTNQTAGAELDGVCDLTAGQTDDAMFTEETSSGFFPQADVSMQTYDLAVSNNGLATLSCQANGPGANARGSIIAIKVGALNVTLH